MSPEATYLLQSLGTIAVFGGALWLATRGLRRLGGGRAQGPLEILARQPLDGRRAIYLVRVGKRVLVVGATDASLTRLGSTSLASLASVGDLGDLRHPGELGEVRGPITPGTAGATTSRFHGILARVLSKKEPPADRS